MGANDGHVLGLTQILNTGPRSERLNIVLCAEGYRDVELGAFASHVQQFVTYLSTEPTLRQYKCAMNVFRIDVASNQSGADDPASCGGSGAAPATYFDASLCAWGVPRAVSVDEGLVLNVVNNFVPQWHFIIVIVNSTKWGGTGGTIAKTTVAPGWEHIAIHEMGHTLFGLADEYDYYLGCGIDTDRNNYRDWFLRLEPAEPNITIDASRAGNKWRGLILPTTSMPTMTNPDCTQCNPSSSPVPPGTVGAFEGAGHYHCGLYRPEFTCKMRNGGNFCAVCRNVIGRKLEPFVYKSFGAVDARFRRIHDYAVAQGYLSGFPNMHEATYASGLVYGSILLKMGAADFEDVPAATLGNPRSWSARVRATNLYAISKGYAGGYPTFHEANYGAGVVYGCILVKSQAADRTATSAAVLGNPYTTAQRIRAAHDYAVTKGYIGGFPTFRQVSGRVYGSLLFDPAAVVWQDVPRSTLGNPNSAEARFRAVSDYASANGFVGGFPNFHEANYGAGVVYGCHFIKPGYAEWRDVPATTLGAPGSPDAMFRAVNDYAVANGFVGGFPNFHQANYGAGVVYGCFLIKPQAARWADVQVDELNNPTGFEARFRALNDYATSIGFAAGLPNFHEADYGPQEGLVLLKAPFAEWRDVLTSDFC